MRDTFLGLNQKKVLELKEKFLDGKGESIIKIEDLILIKRLQDFMSSSKTVQVIVNNNIYSWVKYDVIQEDLPMIFPSLKSLKKRIEKLKGIGIIENKVYRVTKEEITKKVDEDGFETPGSYSVIRLTKECKTIFDFSNMENMKKLNETKGFSHEGVKGYPHEGVKGCPHEGVNKEYQEINTKKNNTIHGKELEFGIFENIFKEFEIKFTTKNQASIKKLLSKMDINEVIKYLRETYINLCLDKSIRSVGAVFSKKIATGERQIAPKAILAENSTLDMNQTEAIDYRAFNRKQKIETMEKEINDIEKIELKEKIKSSITEENEFLDLEALEKIVTEDYYSLLIKRFNKKFLGGK